MTDSTIAIVGSGIAGTTLAYHLVQRGLDVVVFEKGPEYPYPHADQFEEAVLNASPVLPQYELAGDLKYATLSGDYAWRSNLEGERAMVVGGSGTHWGAVTLRMRPSDFRTRSSFGYGTDWPITYAELEPFYCRAEHFLGVAGTDADNPFAPPRSQPFPLPPFELAYDDVVLAERLQRQGIFLHTTPNARTRHAYDGRPPCQNFGTCRFCPIGARYSPRHHLGAAIATGHCSIRPNVSVRRIVVDASGRARVLVYQHNDEEREREHAARVIVVAGGTLESARILLLSTDAHNPDGVGNRSGQVGQHLVFHHYYPSTLRLTEASFPGRIGAPTAQSLQFVDPSTRGRHGGVKIDFHSQLARRDPWQMIEAEEVMTDIEMAKRSRLLGLHAESAPDPSKYVSLSTERDRFGDPFAHVHYECSDFDRETHRFAGELYSRFARGLGAVDPAFIIQAEEFDAVAHHMGTCRMGVDPLDSVTDPWCRVHGSPNLFVVGAANFPGTSGAVHPTLTLTALAIRAADAIAEAAA
jgi:choline dehydrogenase-like flavoprotein